MSRAIKFRVWANGELIPWEQAWHTVTKIHPSMVGGQEGVELSLLTIGLLGYAQKGPIFAEQWTGLQDAKGQDIYEGDILRYEWGNGFHYEAVKWSEQTTTVQGHGERYETLRVGFHLDCYLGPPSSAMVIGNIHQNPELMPA